MADRERPSTPRDRTLNDRATRDRGRRTVSKLLEAAVAEFAAYGYQGARVGRIATRAGMAHGTFYVYFKDKDDLLVALYDEMMGEYLKLVHSLPPLRPGDDGRAEVHTWVAAMCDDYRRHAAVRSAVHDAMMLDADRRLTTMALRGLRNLTDVLADRIRATGSPDLDPEIAALCVSNLLNAASQAVAQSTFVASFDELVEGLTELLHRSIFGASGVPNT